MARDIANGVYWDESWSPIIGCTHPGCGCVHCWAVVFAHRFASNNPLFAGLTHMTPKGVRWNGLWRLNSKQLADPLNWSKPRYVGCNWMGDMCHPGVPNDVIVFILSIMASSPDHTFFLLTKFPQRLAFISYLLRWKAGISGVQIGDKTYLLAALAWLDEGYEPKGGVDLKLRGLPGNVWAGTSISQASEGGRITNLSRVVCKHRWASLEPLYHPIELPGGGTFAAPDVDWIVCGGENYAKPKPIPLDYCRWLRDKCADNDIPFFFKQMHGRTKAERQNIPDDLMIRQMPDTTRRRKDGLKKQKTGVHKR